MSNGTGRRSRKQKRGSTVDSRSFDPLQFVEVTYSNETLPQRWTVSGTRQARRGQQTGESVAIIGLKGSSDYVVVLRFPDGKMESFGPHRLFPARDDVAPA